jgi:hypothetical protein
MNILWSSSHPQETTTTSQLIVFVDFKAVCLGYTKGGGAMKSVKPD